MKEKCLPLCPNLTSYSRKTNATVHCSLADIINVTDTRTIKCLGMMVFSG